VTTAATLAADRFQLWGTAAALCVTDADALGAARALLDETTSSVELACNRFRPDAELLALNASAGRGPFPVSDTLLDLVETAMWAAEVTHGACDPTVLPALLAIGYDDDIERIRNREIGGSASWIPARGTVAVHVDRDSRTVELDAGCALDLGAVAKARCADLAADTIEARLSVGCIVNLGGDLRASGAAPDDGWSVTVAPDARAHRDESLEAVSIRHGGVASSSTQRRRWWRSGLPVHHIVDPRTGGPAEPLWSLVTVAAPSCAAANAMSTAAVVWGDEALFELPQLGVSARLQRPNGTVERVGGWPDPPAT
jgi:thiamine biosynthesis lipoprotein